MNEQERHDLFSSLITRHQGELYAYIFAIVRDWEDASDLFQTVCLVLWRKFASFRPDSSFFAWARQTAQLEVRNYLRRKRPSNPFSEELMDALAGTVVEARSDLAEFYLAALRQCREKLDPAEKELLALRYAEDLSSHQIADRMQRPQSSICRSLKRVRRWLLKCIQTDVARQVRSTNERP
jgi:RNA polymerase sigma-70 factor, ECF subfamily